MAQKLYKIKAATLEEAYQRLRHKFGEDAIVLNTRQAVEGGLFGLFGRRVVEVTVSVTEAGALAPRERSAAERKYQEHSGAHAATTGLPAAAPENLKYLERIVREAQERMNAMPRPAAPAPNAAPTMAAAGLPERAPLTEHSSVTYSRPAAVSPVAAPAPHQAAATAPVLAFPQRKAETLSEDGMRRELSEIRGMLQVLYAENPGAGLPNEFAPHYRRLVQQGVSRRIAAELTAAVLKDSDAAILQDPRVFAERLQFEVRKRVRVAGSTALQPGRGRRIAFCGSTGVGKTTNLAKLAAHYAVRERARVGLITADTYRVAAVDQLRVYANIIGLPLRIANDPREAQAALQEFREFDLVLMDTAGGSQFNLEQINELKNMLAVVQPDETHLVLSAATPLDDLRNAINNFRCLNPTALLFTKLDETRQYGALFSAAIEADLPFGYFSTGQNVPEDLHAANPSTVAALLVEGRMPRG